MRKLIIFLLLIFTATTVYAVPSRVYTYTSDEVIVSSEVTANEDAIFNYLTSGVDTFADNSIVNADINASANIQSDKLNLTAISQGVSITSGGSLTNAGTSALSGVITLSGATTVSGTFAATSTSALSNATITTADINAGTFDGTIGGTTPAAITGTTIKADTSLELATGSTVTGILDEDAMGTNSNTQLATQQSIKAYVDAGGTNAYEFDDTGVISTTDTWTITQTVSAGEAYQVFIDGTVASATFDLYARVNGDGTGSNHNWFITGSYWGGSLIDDLDERATGDDDIRLHSTSVDFADGAQLQIVMYITAKNSETQISWSVYSDAKDGSSSIIGQGFGIYDAAMTSLVFADALGGAGTIEGRWYLFKLNTS